MDNMLNTEKDTEALSHNCANWTQQRPLETGPEHCTRRTASTSSATASRLAITPCKPDSSVPCNHLGRSLGTSWIENHLALEKSPAASGSSSYTRFEWMPRLIYGDTGAVIITQYVHAPSGTKKPGHPARQQPRYLRCAASNLPRYRMRP